MPRLSVPLPLADRRLDHGVTTRITARAAGSAIVGP